MIAVIIKLWHISVQIIERIGIDWDFHLTSPHLVDLLCFAAILLLNSVAEFRFDVLDSSVLWDNNRKAMAIWLVTTFNYSLIIILLIILLDFDRVSSLVWSRCGGWCVHSLNTRSLACLLLRFHSYVPCMSREQGCVIYLFLNQKLSVFFSLLLEKKIKTK